MTQAAAAISNEQLRKLECKMWYTDNSKWRNQLARWVSVNGSGRAGGWKRVWNNLDQFFLLASQTLEETNGES